MVREARRSNSEVSLVSVQQVTGTRVGVDVAAPNNGSHQRLQYIRTGHGSLLPLSPLIRLALLELGQLPLHPRYNPTDLTTNTGVRATFLERSS